jgi:hypothetical protein
MSFANGIPKIEISKGKEEHYAPKLSLDEGRESIEIYRRSYVYCQNGVMKKSNGLFQSHLSSSPPQNQEGGLIRSRLERDPHAAVPKIVH